MRLGPKSVRASEIAIALIGLVCGCQQAPKAIIPRTPGVRDADATIRRLVTDLSIVAADSMEGRAAGSAGAIRVQRYIEAQLQAIGLLRMGEAGGYEQSLRTLRRRVGPSTLNDEIGRASW